MGPEISFRSFTRASGGGLGPGNREFFWVLCACVHKTTYAPMIFKSLYRMIFDACYSCNYDLYGLVRIVFDACRSIMRASGRGFGPGNLEFFGPLHLPMKWHTPTGSMLFHRAQKHSISRAQHPPTCPRNGSSCIKNTMHETI
jgi:hypothetical protein